MVSPIEKRLRRGPNDWKNPEQPLLDEAAALIEAANALIEYNGLHYSQTIEAETYRKLRGTEQNG